jgi:putative thioredoxin
MTAPQFSRPGAIDLSALRKPAPSAGSERTGGASSGAFVVDVTSEAALRSEVVERSLSVVVIVSFWSPTSAASVQINTTLEALADEFGGQFVLARVDVSAQPELAAALSIPQAPLVVAALRGQLAPLIQEPLPEAQMRELVRQVLEAAAAGGVTGTAAPMRSAEEPPDSVPEPVARHPLAEQALLEGDFAAAIAGYEQALAEAPADPEAMVGLARARLLQRVSTADEAAARAAAAAAPDDVPAQTLVADLDLLAGAVEEAFSRLIDVVRRVQADEREAARRHLVDLFAVVGDDDPRVAKARQRLASALF